MQIPQIAKYCHTINKAFCEANGDFSQLDWDDAPANIKASAIAGVNAVLDDPTITPEKLHNKWMDFKIDDGWVWGPVKDAEAKTHPCITAYGNLPDEQRIKDHLFHATVMALRNFQ